MHSPGTKNGKIPFSSYVELYQRDFCSNVFQHPNRSLMRHRKQVSNQKLLPTGSSSANRWHTQILWSNQCNMTVKIRTNIRELPDNFYSSRIFASCMVPIDYICPIDNGHLLSEGFLIFGNSYFSNRLLKDTHVQDCVSRPTGVGILYTFFF